MVHGSARGDVVQRILEKQAMNLCTSADKHNNEIVDSPRKLTRISSIITKQAVVVL